MGGPTFLDLPLRIDKHFSSLMTCVGNFFTATIANILKDCNLNRMPLIRSIRPEFDADLSLTFFKNYIPCKKVFKPPQQKYLIKEVQLCVMSGSPPIKEVLQVNYNTLKDLMTVDSQN